MVPNDKRPTRPCILPTPLGLIPAFLILAGMIASSAHAGSLESKLLPLIQAHAGDVAVAVRHLASGKSFDFREDEPMPTASMIKLPVMIEAYRQADRGDLDLNLMLTLSDADKVPGSGILTPHFTAGTRLSLRDAVRLMIVYSDNTATNLVVDQIGLASTAETMNALGYPNTKLHAKVFRRDTSIFPQRSKQFGLGSTTASETARLLAALHRRTLASDAACEAMIEHLLSCNDRTKLARLLPPTAKIAHKGGSVSAARCDAGIIYSPSGPIVVCVLTSDNRDQSWHQDNAANLLCARIARQVYENFNAGDADQKASRDESLKTGDGGPLVEDLQRTLNVRLSPSPALSVDGDFGPATEAAVKQLQSSHDIAETGIVDLATWKALGTLVTEDAPQPEPEVVNSEELPREAADTLDGPPLVTCKAWAIADAKTCKLLWDAGADERLDTASTTKIMTAFIVVRAARSDPSVLEQEVVFSQRADQTVGSTAGIRAGERISVQELLYGLMLPSGNDASVALAEHFGPSFELPAGFDGEDDPLMRFVAEMNRTAANLAMDGTHYKNPHGLTADGHQSTAQDLLRLAFSAMQSPLFRQYVNTRQRGCKVRGPGGYERNLVWKNTNRLLNIDGFAGVKTGTTTAAGACLVSRGTRGADHLLIVVLGSQSSAARYVDTRNLFRWAWRQREH